MKRVVNGRVYNTATSTLVTTLDDSRRDIGWERTSLYRTQKGNYFLVGEGGPTSRWRCKTSGGGAWKGGEGLRPLDPAQALAFAQTAYADAETIALYFGDVERAEEAHS